VDLYKHIESGFYGVTLDLGHSRSKAHANHIAFMKGVRQPALLSTLTRSIGLPIHLG
jgi:hypothetical protein